MLPAPVARPFCARRGRCFATFVGLVLATQPACGQAQDALQDVANGATKTAVQATDAVDDWVNKKPMQQRREKCAEENGTWVSLVQIGACEDGQVQITFDGRTEVQECVAGEGGEAEDQCAHVNEDGLTYFNDGPSVPHLLQRLSGSISADIDQLRYLDLFWPAGVNHDHCYHHGHMVYGLTHADCDSQYFSDLSAVCDHEEYRQQYKWFKRKSCRQVAATHYAAVRSQGEGPYHVLDSKVVYPAWQPMWQKLGFAEDVTDEDLAQDVEDKLGLVGLLP